MWSENAETPRWWLMSVAVSVVEATLAAEQRPGGVRRRARLAERRAPRPAGLAFAAGGDEGEDDVIAGRERVHARAGRDDLAGSLVAERHRHHPRPRAVDDREVGVAEAGGADPDEELARPRRVELELGDLERPRLGVGPLGAHLAEDGAPDLHDPGSPAGTRRSRLSRSRGGISAGRRVAASTKTWTNQPVAAGASAPTANSPIS